VSLIELVLCRVDHVLGLVVLLNVALDFLLQFLVFVVVGCVVAGLDNELAQLYVQAQDLYLDQFV